MFIYIRVCVKREKLEENYTSPAQTSHAYPLNVNNTPSCTQTEPNTSVNVRVCDSVTTADFNREKEHHTHRVASTGWSVKKGGKL